jgi:hypothetical protein
MAAGKDQLESLVGKGCLLHCVLCCLGHVDQAGLCGECPVAADPIDGSAAGRRYEPDAGVGGHAVLRPALRGDREGLLRGFLGEVKVAEEADQSSEDISPLLAEALLEAPYHSTIGRTSIAPPMLAAGIRAASSSAASRSSASNMQ